MSEPRPALTVVDPHSGEITQVVAADAQSLARQLSAEQDVVRGLQRDIRGWAQRYAELKRDKELEAEEDPLWPDAIEVFGYWKQQCNHPRSQWTLDRFELIRPLIKKYGVELCKRHDGWDKVFASADKLEDFANRAPRSWTAPNKETP